jgi:UDP-N-acetylglucosamine 2-epimerase (non-hydrolysing)
MAGRGKRGRVPELWDGHAAERIAAHLGDWLAQRSRRVEA